MTADEITRCLEYMTAEWRQLQRALADQLAAETRAEIAEAQVDAARDYLREKNEVIRALAERLDGVIADSAMDRQNAQTALERVAALTEALNVASEVLHGPHHRGRAVAAGIVDAALARVRGPEPADQIAGEVGAESKSGIGLSGSPEERVSE